MRTLAGTSVTQLATGQLHTAHLVHIVLTDTVGATYDIFITEFHKNLSYGGNSYLASGHLLNISEIKTTSDLQINDITISMSGIDQTKISEILSYDYIDREVEVQRALITDDDAIYANPVCIFRGRINNPSITDNPNEGTSTVSINASSYLADFERKPSRHTNHLEHNYYYPNDDFFKLWGQIDKEIIWGYVPDK
tara:strand:- start:8138 stop:8722 length:585 start_codon:yes stop_codon:yes gene_type:complete